jgi:hypothetical protein
VFFWSLAIGVMMDDVVNSNVNITLPAIKTLGYSEMSEKLLIDKKRSHFPLNIL